MKLAVVNGDARMEAAGRLLREKGHQVCFLCGSRANQAACITNADGLLLPYPWSIKEECVPGWQGGGAAALLEHLPAGALVMAGHGFAGSPAERLSQGLGHRVAFYGDDTAFADRNAEISAEAAVCAAMVKGGRMLDEQRVLLLGYGRFGKAIGWRLRALGAKVWVMARRQKQRQEAMDDGMLAVTPEQLNRLAPQMELVLNTVPAILLDREVLVRFPGDTLFLELASPPYGIDLAAAAELGRNVEVLPGLPAKYAPASAAAALASAVLRQIGEE